MKTYLLQNFDECYLETRDLADTETGLDLRTSPEVNPFTLEQTLDRDFLPEKLHTWIRLAKEALTHRKNMTATQILNTQLIDGLVQALLALSSEDQQLILQRFQEEKTRHEIQDKLYEYEKRYGLSRQDFYCQFMTGSLGDDAGYIEWAGIYEMLRSQSN